MPTLFLPWLDSRKHATDFQSRCDVNIAESSLAGTVLAGRFKILKAIDADSYKAHDLVLDQTVTIRHATPASKRADDDTWCQKVQQVALVRDPNFLNILDVVSDKSSSFVVTECHSGKSIAELLRERSPFTPEEALALMTPLAGFGIKV